MNCYIASQIRDYNLPKELNKDNTLFFPECGMTTHQMLHTGRPDKYHIVTDSHFLVGLYSYENVFYFDGEEWVNPDFQTYGTSYNILLTKLWNYKNTIPQAVIDGEITNVMGF